MKKILPIVLVLFVIIAVPMELADLYRSNQESEVNNGDEDVVTNDPKEEVVPEEVVVEPEKPAPVEEEKPPVQRPPVEKPTTTEWWKYPSNIKTTTRSGDDLLVLVNKEYKLPSTYAPKDLVKASNAGIRRGESYYLRNIVISDLKEMIIDAKADGIDLSIVSGYRSYATQQTTYNYWLSKNNNDVEYVDTFSARPGHSQHQLGTVIDFSSSEIKDALGDSFANTKASKWLVENSYKYGFVISFPKGFESTTGYKYESWHYRYIGKGNALEMKNSGKILESWLRSKN